MREHLKFKLGWASIEATGPVTTRLAFVLALVVVAVFGVWLVTR